MSLNKSILFAILFVAAASISCEDGWYDGGSGTNAKDGSAMCVQCENYFKTCTTSSTGELLEFKGRQNSNNVCGSSLVYNDGKQRCERECKFGCNMCLVDQDFCTSCDNGFVWNDDFTCLPSTIGLLGTSLVLLVITLVASILLFMRIKGKASS